MAKSLSWPLWPQALSASCLPACCRLVPPYLVFLAGTSLERFADKGAEAAGQARNRRCGGSVSYSAFPPCSLRLAPAPASLAPHPRLFGTARDHRRHCHCHHGAAFPGVTTDRVAAAAETDRCFQAGRPLGRLCDRARFRLRMDAVHWANPRGHFGSGGVRADRDEGREPARGLFARPRNSIHDRGLCDRTVRGLSVALPQLSSSRRASHGGAAGFDRDRISDRQHQPDERVAARNFSDPWQDWLKKARQSAGFLEDKVRLPI